jgi:hypothetical protein
MQLFHAGPQAMLKKGQQTISSSSMTENEISELTAYMNLQELTIPEIEDLVDKFAVTAVRAQKAGFDGVEVNAARMHLLNSFYPAPGTSVKINMVARVWKTEPGILLPSYVKSKSVWDRTSRLLHLSMALNLIPS